MASVKKRKEIDSDSDADVTPQRRSKRNKEEKVVLKEVVVVVDLWDVMGTILENSEFSLGIQDLRSLKNTCRSGSRSVDSQAPKYLTESIVNGLDERGLDGREFCNLLRETGSVISGSFPLQVVSNCYWPESDIDIFSNDEGTAKLVEDYLSKTTEYEPIPDMGFITRDYNYASLADGASLDITTLVPYSKPSGAKGRLTKPRIQVIHHAPKKIQVEMGFVRDTGSIVDHFDLDFCKLRFDGDRLLGRPHVWKAVIDKNSYMGGSVSKFKTCANRILKYKLRGFSIEGDSALSIVGRLAAYDSKAVGENNNRAVSSKAKGLDEVFSVLRDITKEVSEDSEERGEREEWYESVLGRITKSLCECIERRDKDLLPLMRRKGSGISKEDLHRLATIEVDIKMDGRAKVTTPSDVGSDDIDVLGEMIPGFLKYREEEGKKSRMSGVPLFG